MRYGLLKLLVTPVIAEYDDDGQIIGEQAASQPAVVYGFPGVEPFLVQLRKQIDEVNSDE